MTEDFNTNRESNLQERVNILHKQGYRGFTVTGSNRKWDGVKVAVSNKEGKVLIAEGETPDEAYENVIELIDYTLDDAKN
jgi:hypothetical protein